MDLSGLDQGMLNIRYVVRDGAEPQVRGLVDQVLDDKGAVVATWSGIVPAELRDARQLAIPWARHDGALAPAPGLQELAGLLMDGNLFKRPKGRRLSPGLYGEFYGLIHQSELSFGVMGDAWLFPMLLGPIQAFGPKPKKKVALRTVRTLRGGEADMGARVPAVRHLRGKTIAVVGVGALGGPLALELARNGCRELRLLDHDLVEPGNSIRWAVGASAWGQLKTEALRQLIGADYGWTTVTTLHHLIGDAGGQAGDAAVLAELTDGADLVLDCAANFGVTTALDDWCRPLGLPLLSLWATPPVTGGAAVVYRTGSGCPTCLEHHYHAGSIGRPMGLGDEAALQQPAACAERTFTGGSTDLQELVLEAVRMSLELIGANPVAGSRIETLRLVDATGLRVPPSWRVEDLPIHPDCTWQH
jgi:hypothetical protein